MKVFNTDLKLSLYIDFKKKRSCHPECNEAPLLVQRSETSVVLLSGSPSENCIIGEKIPPAGTTYVPQAAPLMVLHYVQDDTIAGFS
jgi:hypothetical protein